MTAMHLANAIYAMFIVTLFVHWGRRPGDSFYVDPLPSLLSKQVDAFAAMPVRS